MQTCNVSTSFAEFSVATRFPVVDCSLLLLLLSILYFPFNSDHGRSDWVQVTPPHLTSYWNGISRLTLFIPAHDTFTHMHLQVTQRIDERARTQSRINTVAVIVVVLFLKEDRQKEKETRTILSKKIIRWAVCNQWLSSSSGAMVCLPSPTKVVIIISNYTKATKLRSKLTI